MPELLAKVDPDMVCYYSPGEIIIRHGDDPESFVVLLRGHVDINCEKTHLLPRQAPALLGEQAFIESEKHSADVAAMGLVKTLVIPHGLVEELLLDAAFARNVMRQLSCKLRESIKDRTWRYGIEQRLFNEFRAHTSATVTNRLLQRGENYGAPRCVDAIILFSDIREFTKTTGQLAPENIAAELGPFLSR